MSKTLNSIEALACKLAERAVSDDTPVELQVEAVKVLAAYYTLLKKSEPSSEEPASATIGALQAELKKVEQSENASYGIRTISGNSRRAIVDEHGTAQPD